MLLNELIDTNGNNFVLVDIDGGEYNLLVSCEDKVPYEKTTFLIETKQLT